MEMIKDFFQSVDVFVSLKVDHTVIYQFIIFTIFFLIFKSLFLSKLQYILELRIDKTTGASDRAGHYEARASKLMDEYNDKMKVVYSKANATLVEGKNTIVVKGKTELKSLENQLEQNYQVRMLETTASAEKRKSSLKERSAELVSVLLNKFKVG